MTGSIRESNNGLAFSPQAWEGIAYTLGLARRELEVLQCLVGDQHEADIAATLGLSRHTVRTYLERLRAKTGAHTRVQLVKRAFAAYRVWVRDYPP